MAVTLTVAELAAALRLGDSTEETAEVTRLLAYATEAVSRHLAGSFVGTSPAIVNEAVVRLSAYLYDQPGAGRGTAYSNALRFSGAAAILMPYRVVRGRLHGRGRRRCARGRGHGRQPRYQRPGVRKLPRCHLRGQHHAN